MKKIFLFILIAGALGVGGALFFQRSGVSKQETEFLFAAVTRGDLENIVSSTGTLSAVGTVEVGSQISGTVERVLVDYNDKVTKVLLAVF
jgi:HlyD family secretion protein